MPKKIKKQPKKVKENMAWAVCLGNQITLDGDQFDTFYSNESAVKKSKEWSNLIPNDFKVRRVSIRVID